MTAKSLKARPTDLAFGDFMDQVLPEIWADVGSDEYPRNACSVSCRTIIGRVREYFDGEFEVVDGEFKSFPHTWIAELESKRILDPTVGQFVSGPAWRVITPGHYLYKYYVAWEEDESGHRYDAGHT